MLHNKKVVRIVNFYNFFDINIRKLYDIIKKSAI